MRILLLPFMPLLALAACQSTDFCECGEFGVGIAVPASRQADVDQVTMSGPGCSSEVVVSSPGVYWAQGLGEGTCHVVVTWKSGAAPFMADVAVKLQSVGCCTGFLGDGVIVPELDGGGAGP